MVVLGAGLAALLAGPLSHSAQASEVVVAVTGPSAGPFAARTRAIFAGVEAAKDEINLAGGIKGVAIKLIRKDDQCSAKGAAAIAEELIKLKIDLVIGHPCGSAAESAAKVYAAHDILFIAPSSRHPGLTAARAGPSIFRIAGRDDKQAAAAAAFPTTRGDGKTVAVVNDRTRFARGLARRVTALVENRTGRAPISAALIAGEKDFPRTVAKIKAADLVFYAGFPLEAGMLFGELRQAGSAAGVLFSDSVGSGEFVKTFGADVRDTYVLRARFAIDGDPLSLQSEHDERLRLGDRVNGAAALEAYASAGRQANTLAAKEIAIVLNGYALDTRLGVIRFDANGDAMRPSYDVLRWTGHSWEGLKRSPLDSLPRELPAQWLFEKAK